MRVINVCNLHHKHSGEIWPVHRPYPLGNPYRRGVDDDPIAQYKQWLWAGIKARDGRWHELVHLAQVYLAKGELNLGCWCHPRPCHADIILRAIEYIINDGLPEVPLAVALIGPRKITIEHGEHLSSLGRKLEDDYPDITARSGGAPGSDQAWMRTRSQGEIYLPWPSFEIGKHPQSLMSLPEPSARALAWARWTHAHASNAVQRLMARNWHIMLGPQLSTPVRYVLYANDGSPLSGGTKNAVAIAQLHGIDVYPISLENGLPEFNHSPTASA
jgi:hypothetical protein